MINRSRQEWTVGSTVKVGFMTLVVLAAVPTPGDFAPDAYVLRNKAASCLYKFVPHCGLSKLTAAEAQALVAGAKELAERAMAASIAKVTGREAFLAFSAELQARQHTPMAFAAVWS